ncbi:hypothetical protein D4Q76_00330, partial [archaeon]
MYDPKEDRIKEFYVNIVKMFDDKVIQRYFGEETEFIDCIKSCEKKDDENVLEVELKNNLRISFSLAGFSLIFCQDNNIVFEESKG